MISNIYAIKDTKVGFLQIFISSNDYTALRDFSNVVNTDGTLIYSNYEDFELYCLGTYNQENGEISSDVKFIASAISVKKEV